MTLRIEIINTFIQHVQLLPCKSISFTFVVVQCYFLIDELIDCIASDIVKIVKMNPSSRNEGMKNMYNMFITATCSDIFPLQMLVAPYYFLNVCRVYKRT